MGWAIFLMCLRDKGDAAAAFSANGSASRSPPTKQSLSGGHLAHATSSASGRVGERQRGRLGGGRLRRRPFPGLINDLPHLREPPPGAGQPALATGPRTERRRLLEAHFQLLFVHCVFFFLCSAYAGRLDKHCPSQTILSDSFRHWSFRFHSTWHYPCGKSWLCLVNRRFLTSLCG